MPLRFTLRQLEYFVAVCECGSIALAAQKVNVSSPTISAAIGQLEAEFGLQLFVRRHAQGLSLSQVGERFLVGAREALDKARAITELANDIAGNVRGNFRVGCLLTFAQIMLPKLRRGFVDMYPEVTFFQYERDQSELFEDLRAARIDVALTYDLNVPADFHFLPLIDLPPFALLSETHPLSNNKVVTPAELAEFPMVLLDLPMSSEYFLSLLTDAGVTPNIVERTRDIAVMRSLVANDFGYSIANIKPLSDRAPDGGRLRYVPLAAPVRALRLGLMMTAGAETSRNVAAFVAHVQHQVTPDTAFAYQA
ncbi:LysR family transcriptional regulator [Pseudooceanicola sp. CBS1P-1]|uniref:LysR family transcriptional regulator n=1 Tax=Pseudooceanicola albus TaxID=2692189 RepID=A0A6L7G4L3_9RHOB|nr:MULTISPECIES: LysR family transcriptional regulator [Pseudooceanicola]MBT9385352.1 LysR family transcriptional regulator [Pseudooceanicola endophyticus]MXN18789.1 LysR family transcriptional regulator [Pseudooceanicola albus]